MKHFKIAAVLAGGLLLITATAGAQAPTTTENITVPVAVGGQAAPSSVSLDTSNHIEKVVVEAAPQKGGGIIQLSAFGWLQPYADSLVQLLIAAGFAWFGKSRYSAMLDKDSRDALETFVKNRASSLIADGAVKLQGKAIHVDSGFLYRAASEGSTAIPDALKRFGITPDIVAQKIVDAIPQTPAGAAIVATAHADDNSAPEPVLRPVGSAPSPGFAPPVSGASA